MKVQGNTILITSLVCIAIASRVVPHYPNFTAVGAVALFGGAYMSRRWAIIIPLLAVFLSDLFLNNFIYAEFMDGFALFTPNSWWLYGSFILISLLGIGLLKKVTPGRFLGGALGAAIIFYVITNFGVWMSSPTDPKTLAALIARYVAGEPFFWNTLMGNLAFGSVMFGVYEYYLSRQDKRAAIESEKA